MANTRSPGTTMPTPEPAWFANQGSAYIYKHGILQSAVAFSPHNGEDCIMAMIGGRLFKIVPRVNTCKVVEVLIEGVRAADQLTNAVRNLRNQNNLPIAYMVQADKWLIAQDGSSLPIIYDGTKARRSITTGTVDETEIPVGTIMAYGMGRLCVIVNDRDVAFGDLYGSHDRVIRRIRLSFSPSAISWPKVSMPRSRSSRVSPPG